MDAVKRNFYRMISLIAQLNCCNSLYKMIDACIDKLNASKYEQLLERYT